MPRRQSPVGQSIYDEVQQMRADNPGMTRQAAFEAIGQNSDRSVGTIAANYYRIARQQGEGRKVKRRQTRRPNKAVVAVAPVNDGEVESIDLDKLEAEMTAAHTHAVAVIRATKERLAEVEAMSQRLESARQALSR